MKVTSPESVWPTGAPASPRWFGLTNVKQARDLLESGHDPAVRNDRGETPLMAWAGAYPYQRTLQYWALDERPPEYELTAVVAAFAKAGIDGRERDANGRNVFELLAHKLATGSGYQLCTEHWLPALRAAYPALWAEFSEDSPADAAALIRSAQLRGGIRAPGEASAGTCRVESPRPSLSDSVARRPPAEPASCTRVLSIDAGWLVLGNLRKHIEQFATGFPEVEVRVSMSYGLFSRQADIAVIGKPNDVDRFVRAFEAAV